MSAALALRDAAVAALRGIEGLGVHDPGPVQAAFPHAQVEVGPETDWGHKDGDGRELRIAVVVRDRGERPDRLYALAEAVAAAVGGLGDAVEGWQVVSVAQVRMRMAREAQGWACVVEFRARALRR